MLAMGRRAAIKEGVTSVPGPRPRAWRHLQRGSGGPPRHQSRGLTPAAVAAAAVVRCRVAGSAWTPSVRGRQRRTELLGSQLQRAPVLDGVLERKLHRSPQVVRRAASGSRLGLKPRARQSLRRCACRRHHSRQRARGGIHCNRGWRRQEVLAKKLGWSGGCGSLCRCSLPSIFKFDAGGYRSCRLPRSLVSALWGFRSSLGLKC